MRDYIKNQGYFDEHPASSLRRLGKLHEGMQNAGDDKEKRERYIGATGVALYGLIKTKYSAGSSLEDVKSSFDELSGLMNEFWDELSSICYMYDMMAVAADDNLIETKRENKRRKEPWQTE